MSAKARAKICNATCRKKPICLSDLTVLKSSCHGYWHDSYMQKCDNAWRETDVFFSAIISLLKNRQYAFIDPSTQHLTFLGRVLAQKRPEAMPKFSFLSKNLVCNLDHYLYDFENFLTLSKTSDCNRSKTLPKSVKNLKRGRRLCPNFHFWPKTEP